MSKARYMDGQIIRGLQEQVGAFRPFKGGILPRGSSKQLQDLVDPLQSCELDGTCIQLAKCVGSTSVNLRCRKRINLFRMTVIWHRRNGNTAGLAWVIQKLVMMAVQPLY